jgi:hypothetical protein
MTKLSYLHEPGVLENLKIRYELNEIYVRLFSLYYDNLQLVLAALKEANHLLNCFDRLILETY